jgi:flagellar basal body-associated protein FliL
MNKLSSGAVTGSNSPGISIALVIILAVVISLIVIAIATYFFSRYLNEKFEKTQQLDADNIVLASREKAQLIESEAKDNGSKYAGCRD